MASGSLRLYSVDFHLQIYNIKIDKSNKSAVFFYDKTHFLTHLVSPQPLKGLFNIPKLIFTTSFFLNFAGTLYLTNYFQLMKKQLTFLALLAAAATQTGATPAGNEARLLRFPATNGRDVVFSYAGDLYTAPLAGGEAPASLPTWATRFSHASRPTAGR